MRNCPVCIKPQTCDCICSTCTNAREQYNAEVAEYRYNVREARNHSVKCDCDVCKALGYVTYTTNGVSDG